jgi:hypothetical protein
MHDPQKHEPTRRLLAMRRAAVRFANDYGPLPAANAGDERAQHEIAKRLHDFCEAEGLRIILKPQS